MMTLYTFAPSFGQISASPFSVKAIWMMQLSGQPWQREILADPRKMPKGKLPVLRDGDRMIADSDAIRAYLEGKGAAFDEGLSDLDRANARAFIRMAEEHMYFHQVMDRWGHEDVWPIIRDTYFDMIPKPIRGIVTGRLRKQLMRGLDAQGLGRFTESERLERLEADLQAIAARLWQTKFLFADVPTSADLSVAAVLGGMRASPAPTLLSQRIATDAVLCDYIDRCEAALNPAEG